MFDLLQLNIALRRAIHQATGDRYFWIRAEIAQITERSHTYLELAQHENGVRVAVMRGMIWRNDLLRIEQELGEERRSILKQGTEILFRARVQFHEVFGLGLSIEEIDLSFNLGELEKRKRATIAKLKEEGLFDLNRQLPEPIVVQRIALVTSSTSAACADLLEHLGSNEHGYRFHVHLFNSIVQGESAARELQRALASIKPDRFDAVVIVRGGGSRLDLEAYNDLELCRAVARMPIPVMTGIGHETDISVVDMIAKAQHRTPTAIADHLIDKCLYFETALSGFLVNIHRMVADRSALQKERMSRWTEMLQSRPIAHCQLQRARLNSITGQLQRNAAERIGEAEKRSERALVALKQFPLQLIRDRERVKLRDHARALGVAARKGVELLIGKIDGMNDAIRMLSPERTMQRGFSITRINGKAITDATVLAEGDLIETTFARGNAISKIERIGNDDH